MNTQRVTKAISILSDLIAFNSVSRESNLPVIDYIARYLDLHKVPYDIIPSPDGNKANILARIGEANTGGMVWSGHTDVVPVDGQAWDTDPFTLIHEGDRLYGRGCADMKGFIACCLAMVPELITSTRTKPIYFAFSYDEEIGCLGIPYLVKHALATIPMPAFAIIGEPTMMQVVTAHKGVLSFETTVHGLEWHSSQPHLGVNAVQVACELVHFLTGMSRELAEHGLRDERFTPATTTVHVGTISGGTARNIIPKECVFQWEIRPLPNYDGDKLFERFTRKCDALREQIKTVSLEADIVTRPMSRMLGVTLPSKAEKDCAHIMHAAKSNRQLAVSFGTEAGVFNENGIPAIICGPGDIQQAHKPNEFVTVEQMGLCLDFLTKIMDYD